MFIGRTDVEAETPILWPPDVKSWLIWKDPDAGKDWRWEEKGMTKDEIVGASLTQWTWVWVNSRSWWWTGRPGVLQSMGSQRVGHDWVTELNCITVSDIPLKKCFTGPNLRLRNCCSEKEKQRMSFSFLFLRTKKIKRTGAGLNIPSFLLQLLLTLPVCN